MAEKIINNIKLPNGEVCKIGGASGFELFDTILKDHILTYEQTKGWALQGTYVYKEAVAGSRYGYPDFYNKCVEEFENSEIDGIPWEQPILSSNGTLGGDSFAVDGTNDTQRHPAYYAWDGNSSTHLPLTSTQVKETVFYNPQPLKISYIDLTYYADTWITNGELYGSNDNDSYELLATFAHSSANATIEVNSTNFYKYHKIKVLGANGSDGTSRVIADIINIKVNAVAPFTRKNPNGHIFYDIADKSKIDELYNTNGIAWYYGIDKENERIFLPRTKHFAFTGGVMGNGMTLGWTDGATTYGTATANPNNASSVARPTLNALNKSLGTVVSGTTDSDIINAGKETVIGITTDPTKSGITLETDDSKYLYICVGNTNVESAVTDVVDVTTTENDTVPLFTGMYFDFTPNNVSWLRGGEQANSGGVYTFTYNELVNILNGETKYGDLKVIDVADMVTGEDYSLYWKVNQEDTTFITPTAISNKALSGGVMGNGITLGLTDGTNNAGFVQDGGTNNYLCSRNASYGENVGFSASGDKLTTGSLGITTDPDKSGIIAEQSTSQLYFKVANAVQNLELLDAGEVLEVLSTKTDKLQACEASFPSNKCIDLTLNASGSTYTAPANGWFYIGKGISANQYFIFDNMTSHFAINNAPAGSNSIYNVMPVTKGDIVQVRYTASGTTNYFRFIYAQGEV